MQEQGEMSQMSWLAAYRSITLLKESTVFQLHTSLAEGISLDE